MRRTIAIAILTTIFCGLIGWAATEIEEHGKKIAVNQTKIEANNKKFDHVREDLKDIHSDIKLLLQRRR